MRLALLTDLHANREAVEACLAHAERQHVDQYAFTGDFVGYGADPAWVVRTVMEYVARGAVAVQGNHDVGHAAPEPADARGSARSHRLDPRPARCRTAGLPGRLPLAQQHGNAFFRSRQRACDPIAGST
jgi:predicted phosphodiesterase